MNKNEHLVGTYVAGVNVKTTISGRFSPILFEKMAICLKNVLWNVKLLNSV
jgi:hypothetical protein